MSGGPGDVDVPRADVFKLEIVITGQAPVNSGTWHAVSTVAAS